MLWEKHLEHFLLVLMKLKEVKLKLNFNKCEFVKTNIGLLGHVVSREGRNPTKSKK
jgi:hypothetical protein